MSRTPLVLLFVLLLAAGAFVAWRLADDAPTAPAPRPEGVAAPAAADADEPTARAPERDAERRPTAHEPPAAEAPADPSTVTGLVVDAAGAPVADVGLSAGGASARSDAGGLVALPSRALRSVEDLVVAPPHALVAVGRREAGAPEAVVVVAPAVVVAGQVVDPDGLPLADASVRLSPRRELGRLPFLLVESARGPAGRARTTTDAEGRFRFEAVPGAEGIDLVVARDGFRRAEQPVPPRGSASLLLELEPRDADRESKPLLVRAEVLGRAGAPAVGAEVRFGGTPQAAPLRTDARGRFELPVERVLAAADPAEDDPDLWIRHDEHGVERFDALLAAVRAAHPAPPGLVTLRFTREPLFVSGTLEVADGAPAEEWTVRALSGVLVHDAFPRSALDGWAEGELAATTAADGTFRLGPLLPRPYELVAVDPDVEVAVRGPAVEPPLEELAWTLAPPALLPRLAGRVVDRDGEPLAGVRIVASADFWRMEAGFVSTRGASRRSPPTDADGRFELRDVPGTHATLAVKGDVFPPLERLDLAVETLEDPEDVTLVVTRQRVLRLALSGDVSSDEDGAWLELRALDATGEPVLLQSGGMSTSGLRLSSASEPYYTCSSEAVVAEIVRRHFEGGEEQPPELLTRVPLKDGETLVPYEGE